VLEVPTNDREVRGSRSKDGLRGGPAEAVFGRRETLGPPEMLRGALDSAGRPRCESGESDPGTHEVRVHAVRLGGRSRLDALRVFFAGRSQGLLEKEGASLEEVRSTF
jgi:hypothetical protein